MLTPPPNVGRFSQGGVSHLQADVRSTRAIWVFVALAFVWAWGVGLAATQVKTDLPELSVALMILAGFAPSFAGFAVVAGFSNLAGLRDWARNCVSWRVNWRWFVFGFFAPPAVMLCALALHVALGGELPALHAAAMRSRW